MSGIAIRAEGLGKKYRIGARERYKSLRDALTETASGFFRSKKRPPAEEIWALKEVSLTVRRGERVGIVGSNGAGKTTFLKILSRITEPTEGSVSIRGKLGSLLEVGTGFHPELTGRDNIFLSGAILGMSRREILSRFDEIVGFSGVEKFINTPMKRYSSGMQVRLAFAIAAHLEPDVFLIDEVLAVGDMAFQEKCLGKMEQVASGGRTLLFVSHNMSALRSLCSTSILLDRGRVRMIGKTGDVIRAYTEQTGAALGGRIPLAARTDRFGTGEVRMVSFQAGAKNQLGPLSTGAEATFRVGYESRDGGQLHRLSVAIHVTNLLGTNVFLCTTQMTELRWFRDLPPEGVVVCRIRQLPLLPGKYWVNISLKFDPGLEGVADYVQKAAEITVIDDGSSGLIQLPQDGSLGSVAVPHTWEMGATATVSNH